MIAKNLGSSVFSKKMSELCDLRIENDKEILEGLTELSAFLPSNTVEQRRNLKSLIEGRIININKEFLDSFKEVIKSLNKVKSDTFEMNSSLLNMKNSLAVTKKDTKSLIERTVKIDKEVKIVTCKKNIINAVIEKFQFSPNEVSLLRNGEISSEIFLLLNKGEDIISNCKLVLQTINTFHLGQDIIEQMMIYQDFSMERLLKWLRGNCNMLEATSLNPFLPVAMAKLQKKSNLFQQILDEISANLGIMMVRQFIDALTQGGRPIEHKVNDPKCYIGDMLAWLHQALPNAIEYLNFLLKNCDNSDEFVQQSLKKSTEGICHPLKVRVEHILLTEENFHNTVLRRDIYILLKDYENILFQIIQNSRLNTTLNELSEVAEKTFLLSLQNNVSSILNKDKKTTCENLFVDESSEKILELLVQILSSSISTQLNERLILQIVSSGVDPLMNRITEKASKLSSVEMAVYLLNNFHFIETSLALFPFLDERLERLKAQCDAQIDTLTSAQASVLIGNLNLGSIYTVLQGNPPKPLHKIPALDVSQLSIVSIKMEKFLASSALNQLPQLALLSSTVHKSTIKKRSFTVVASIYANLHQAVHDPENEFPNPMGLLPLSPENVNNVLLNDKNL